MIWGSNTMTEKRFVLTSEKIGKHWEILITDYQTDEPFDDTSYDATNNYQDTLDNMEDLCLLLNELHEENQALKSDLTRVIEQSRKNNELCVSDIRILEKALWCSSCENDYDRLKQLRKEFLK